MDYRQLFVDTDFVHASGTEEERKVANLLKERCESLGVSARIEEFSVPMATIQKASLTADGKELPCKGLFCCGSGTVEGELYYMPGTDPVSIARAAGKIVLLDSQGVSYFVYQDLVKAGALGLIFQYGNLQSNPDIDERDLRKAVVGDAKKLLSVMINVSTGVELVKEGVSRVSITVEEEEYEGISRNVIAEIPGKGKEWITLTAHYDTTRLSHGAYDNMTGCAGLLGVMEALKDQMHTCGLRFIFCGSEERGLLGSKAYTAVHEEDLAVTALNINLDMIGTYMGKFISVASAEDKLPHYISYMGAELGFPVEARTGVYSSDSTPFADKGVPAVSFARAAGNAFAPIHCRYDTMDVLSMSQLEKDTAFIAEFTRRMADAWKVPVAREIPEDIKRQLDEYLFRKKKKA